MNKMPRYIAISLGVVAWLVLLVSDIAFAQSKTRAGLGQETYPEVTLTPVQPIVEEYSTKGKGGVPEFITEFSHYTLGKEDVIEIMVLRHPEVSGEYIINKEGKIQYEFVGDVKIEGMKKEDVRKLLVKLLSEYIISPSVTMALLPVRKAI